MNRDDVRYGQRIRVNLPGVGDHGQLGTVTRIWGSFCSIHLDWDEQPQHVVVLYARDLDLLSAEPLNAVPDVAAATAGVARGA